VADLDFEQALVYEINSINGLQGRVFPQAPEEGTKAPYVVYNSSEGEPVMTLNGPSNMTELSCDIHVIAESYEQLKGLTKAVLDRIRSFFQRAIGQNGPVIRSISHVEPVEDVDTNLNYHKSSFDIRVRF
jgi:Protein of unknown function (DUF3168)